MRQCNSYLCVIENTVGLSHRIIQALLNSVIRQACKDQGLRDGDNEKPMIFSYKHASGGSRKIAYQPHVELQGYLADDLAQDLDQGTLRWIDLVKQSSRQTVGGDQYLIEDKYQLRILADKGMPPKGRLGRIRQALKKKVSNFDVARIVFKDRENKSHSVEVNLDNGSAEQSMYVRTAYLRDISPPLHQSCEHIQDQIAKRMVTVSYTHLTLPTM